MRKQIEITFPKLEWGKTTMTLDLSPGTYMYEGYELTGMGLSQITTHSLKLFYKGTHNISTDTFIYNETPLTKLIPINFNTLTTQMIINDELTFEKNTQLELELILESKPDYTYPLNNKLIINFIIY